MSDKVTTALLAMVIGLTMLTCLCYLAIFIVPEVPFNPYPPSDATMRASQSGGQASEPATPVIAEVVENPTSIFGPTWTPTQTPIPSETPTPTETRTPTPTATNTPTPTNFPTKTPTSTATRTNTPLPPPPTPTPLPLYRVVRQQGVPNCEVLRVTGIVFDANGLPLPGVVFQVGEKDIPGSRFNTAPTDANGRYIWDFGGPQDRKQVWFVQPLENGQPAPGVPLFTFQTDPVDVCEFDSSIQIMNLDWRRRATQ